MAHLRRLKSIGIVAHAVLLDRSVDQVGLIELFFTLAAYQVNLRYAFPEVLVVLVTCSHLILLEIDLGMVAKPNGGTVLLMQLRPIFFFQVI